MNTKKNPARETTSTRYNLSKAMFAGAKATEGANAGMIGAVVAAAKVWGNDVDVYTSLMDEARAAYIAAVCAMRAKNHVEFANFTKAYSAANIARAHAILKRSDPSGKAEKNDKRTEAEQKVYRAAITAWNRLLESAGVAKPEAKKRKASVAGSKAQANAAKKKAAAPAKAVKAFIEKTSAGIETGTLAPVAVIKQVGKAGTAKQLDWLIACLIVELKKNGKHIPGAIQTPINDLIAAYKAEYPAATE